MRTAVRDRRQRDGFARLAQRRGTRWWLLARGYHPRVVHDAQPAGRHGGAGRDAGTLPSYIRSLRYRLLPDPGPAAIRPLLHRWHVLRFDRVQKPAQGLPQQEAGRHGATGRVRPTTLRGYRLPDDGQSDRLPARVWSATPALPVRAAGSRGPVPGRRHYP